MQKCEDLLWTCRNCRRTFRRDERYLNCPDCGETRECSHWANANSIYCNDHGGINPKRPIRARETGRPMKTGKQSKFLIPRMASKYLEQSKNPMHLLNRESVDLVNARIIDLLERIDAESSPERVSRIIELWNKLNAAAPGIKFDVSNDKEAFKAYNALDAEMEAAYHDYQAWRQIFEALDFKRKLNETDTKILKEMKAMMTAEDGMELVAQLFAAVMEVLKDEPKGSQYITLIRIKFEALTGAAVDREVQTRGGEVIDL